MTQAMLKRSVFDSLDKRGIKSWLQALGKEVCLSGELSPDQPLALVFGNEHEGVSNAAIAAADGLVHIPMKGFTESFNISSEVYL